MAEVLLSCSQMRAGVQGVSFTAIRHTYCDPVTVKCECCNPPGLRLDTQFRHLLQLDSMHLGDWNGVCENRVLRRLPSRVVNAWKLPSFFRSKRAGLSKGKNGHISEAS